MCVDVHVCVCALPACSSGPHDSLVIVPVEVWKSRAAPPCVLEPLKVVWAKCSGYPSFPALVSECQPPRLITIRPLPLSVL